MRFFNTLIIDPDADRRMRLKQASRMVPEFSDIKTYNALDEVQVYLQCGKPMDVWFISDRFDFSDISTFIKQAKDSHAGRDAAYILIASVNSQGDKMPLNHLVSGADTVLCEPFSVESLSEMTKLANKIKEERVDSRERGTLAFLVQEIIQHLDQVAHSLSSGSRAGMSVRILREMCAPLTTLSPETRQRYFETILEMFPEARITNHEIFEAHYVGASRRVKERRTQRFIAKLKEMAE